MTELEQLSYAGSEMRELRALAGESQPQWAARLRSTKKKISNYENDVYKTPAHLLLLARITADPRRRREWMKSLPRRKRKP